MNRKIFSVANRSVSALCILLPVVSQAAPPQKIEQATPAKAVKQFPQREFAVTLWSFRIRVAEDGTKTRELVSHNEIKGSPGQRLYSQMENMVLTSVPAINPNKTVNLHATVSKVSGSVNDARSFIYRDTLPSLSKLSSGLKVQFASISYTDDMQVVTALQQRTPLPTTGKPYSVMFLYASGGTYIPKQAVPPTLSVPSASVVLPNIALPPATK